MMKNKLIIAALVIGFSFNGSSQEEENNNSIDSQFKDLIENSNDYQSYKVIEKSKLTSIHKNINDSIADYEKSISESNEKIMEQKNDIENSHQEIDSLNTQLAETQRQVENIDFFGISTQKSTFTTIMLSIIIGLFLVSLIMFFAFKKGQNQTKLAKTKLDETQLELESLRKRSLEREQKIRRELQDELNKRNLRKD